MGAKVACVDIDELGNEETAQIIKDCGGVATSYKCDVSKKDQIKVLHAKVRADLGPVDIIINNAGIVWGNLYIDPEKDQFITDQVNVNLMAHIWVSVVYLLDVFSYSLIIILTSCRYLYIL